MTGQFHIFLNKDRSKIFLYFSDHLSPAFIETNRYQAAYEKSSSTLSYNSYPELFVLLEKLQCEEKGDLVVDLAELPYLYYIPYKPAVFGAQEIDQVPKAHLLDNFSRSTSNGSRHYYNSYFLSGKKPTFIVDQVAAKQFPEVYYLKRKNSTTYEYLLRELLTFYSEVKAKNFKDFLTVLKERSMEFKWNTPYYVYYLTSEDQLIELRKVSFDFIQKNKQVKDLYKLKEITNCYYLILPLSLGEIGKIWEQVKE